MIAAQPALFDDLETAGSDHPAAVLFRCHPCERRTGRPRIWRRSTARTLDPCPSCQTPTTGRPITGTYSAARDCDARCIYAKGPICVCSCGGRNHGLGFHVG